MDTSEARTCSTGRLVHTSSPAPTLTPLLVQGVLWGTASVLTGLLPSGPTGTAAYSLGFTIYSIVFMAGAPATCFTQHSAARCCSVKLGAIPERALPAPSHQCTAATSSK